MLSISGGERKGHPALELVNGRIISQTWGLGALFGSANFHFQPPSNVFGQLAVSVALPP